MSLVDDDYKEESPDIEKDKSDKSGNGSEVRILENPVIALPLVKQDTSGSVSPQMSPVMQEMQGVEQPVNEEVFDEIPVEVCGQLYKTALEVGFTLKNKGMPMRELPPARVNTQAGIIYGIMKKNQINIKHIDLFMLAAGMMADYKYMGTFAEEQKNEDEYRGSAKENDSGEYGEIDG